MIFEQGMHCPKCAEIERKSIIVEADDIGLLQCPDPHCLAMFINMPDGQDDAQEVPPRALH